MPAAHWEQGGVQVTHVLVPVALVGVVPVGHVARHWPSGVRKSSTGKAHEVQNEGDDEQVAQLASQRTHWPPI